MAEHSLKLAFSSNTVFQLKPSPASPSTNHGSSMQSSDKHKKKKRFSEQGMKEFKKVKQKFDKAIINIHNTLIT